MQGGIAGLALSKIAGALQDLRCLKPEKDYERERLRKMPLPLPREELVDCAPARKLGVPLHKELQAKMNAWALIKQTATVLKAGDFCLNMAMMYVDASFAREYPLHENKRAVVACACLLLASKTTDAIPYPHLERVVDAFLPIVSHRNIKKIPSEEMQSYKKEVVDAEKKVLLHIDFDFMINEMQELLRSMHEARDLLMGMVDTSTLTESSMRALEEGLPALSERKFKDALKTTLVLQYPPRALGVALVRAAQLELEQAGKLPSGAVMPVGQGQWWEYFGVSVEQAEDVVDQLKELLQTAKMGTR